MGEVLPTGGGNHPSALDRPVQVIGVMNRCGSNYLAQLLAYHPDLHLPRARVGRERAADSPHVLEDYLLKKAHLLETFVQETARHWGIPADAGQREQAQRMLLRQIAQAALASIAAGRQPHQRLLLKTPRPFNLDLAQRLYPGSQMVLLMRDGRDVADSATRSFPYAPFRVWAKRWSRGAAAFQRYMQDANPAGEGRHWILLRYEQLVDDPAAHLRQVLAFLQLDPTRYPWERVDQAPVIGSSRSRTAGDALDWTPRRRPKGFKPVGRWRSWPMLQRLQFHRIAGRELLAWGYAPDRRWVVAPTTATAA